MLNIEAFLLTGGASLRMGRDKATLQFEEVGVARAIAQKLIDAGHSVTILGRETVPGILTILDKEEHGGPLKALTGITPACEAVFVSSCDMPLFDAKIVRVLGNILDGAEQALAAVPVIQGIPQPLCAVYRDRAWVPLMDVALEGKRSMMAWLDRMKVISVDEERLIASGIDPPSISSANTPEEWEKLTGGQPV